MEHETGIEPAFPAWKAGVLPLYDSCMSRPTFAGRVERRNEKEERIMVSVYNISVIRIFSHFPLLRGISKIFLFFIDTECGLPDSPAKPRSNPRF